MFYDCLTRIPLIVSWPGHIPEGVVDESMANLVDIVPTLFALQDIDIPAGMEGEPLPTCTNAAPRDATFSEYGAGGRPFTANDLDRMRAAGGIRPFSRSLQWREAEGKRKMIRTRDWKVVHDPMGDKDELYDLGNDPWEQENLIDDASFAGKARELKSRLLDWAGQDTKSVPLPDYPPIRS
ncbi:unnamed protein product [marine sediment metagenome]|uniref:N-sulphoglucosamine sulphohydrolase C-terminal domain-containing protein n=1 Tax=marine sediment metagenome TaxID=412755 RepID=X0XJT6_9ZZZZ